MRVQKDATKPAESRPASQKPTGPKPSSQVPSTTGATEDEFLNMIVYGQSKIGKTRFIATALDDPRTDKPLLLSIDWSLKSIRSRTKIVDSVKELGSPTAGVMDVLRINTWDDWLETYDYLFESDQIGKMPYNLISIDTLTELHYLDLMHVSGTDPNKLSSKLIEIGDYGVANANMKKVLRGLRDIDDIHAIYTAQLDVREDQMNIAQQLPMFTGKTGREAIALIPLVAQYRLDSKDRREMLFQPQGRAVAGDQYERSILGSSMIDPTVTKVLNGILGIAEEGDSA